MARLFLDLETNGLDTSDITVTCAATLLQIPGDDPIEIGWHSAMGTTMTGDTLERLVDYVLSLKALGVSIFTFNGIGFDWRVLSSLVPSRADAIAAAARTSYDIMFQFLCDRGHFASLQSFLEGEQLTSKTMTGEDAANLWADGPPGARQQVLEYCQQDCRCLAALVSKIEENKGCWRVAKSGNRSFWKCPQIMHADDSIANRQEIDTSWMKDPPSPSKVVSWALGDA